MWAESVLRYGLPAKFNVFLLKPNLKYENKVRTALNQVFSELGQFYLEDIKSTGADEGLGSLGIASEKLYPYVFQDISLHI